MRFKIGILAVLCLLGMTSCKTEIYHDSLDDYIKIIEKHDLGYSNAELDIPELFLPSKTFITDYEYLDGSFHYYDPGLFTEKAEIVFLSLKYSNDNYILAKKYAITNLDLTSKNNFVYNDYYFYENMAHPKHYGNGKNGNIDESGNNKFFPRWFTMFSYKDKINTLIFIGCHSAFSKEEQNKILNDWGYFLTTYYGKYYDFTK